MTITEMAKQLAAKHNTAIAKSTDAMMQDGAPAALLRAVNPLPAAPAPTKETTTMTTTTTTAVKAPVTPAAVKAPAKIPAAKKAAAPKVAKKAAAKPAVKAAKAAPKKAAAKAPVKAKTAPKATAAAPKAKVTRKDEVIALMKRPQGVKCAEIEKKFDLLPHSVRALISGIGKNHKVATTKESGEPTVYRIK